MTENILFEAILFLSTWSISPLNLLPLIYYIVLHYDIDYKKTPNDFPTNCPQLNQGMYSVNKGLQARKDT